MSQLADYEDAIVTRLAEAELSGEPAFRIVRGCSGGYRPVIRDALRRESPPAAYVAFVEEDTAPDVKPSKRGPVFAVLIATRTLRAGADARHDDVEAAGAFTLVDAARTQLDGFELDDGIQLVCLSVRFAEADDRSAVYELRYRVWPVFPSGVEPGAPTSPIVTALPGADEVTLSWSPPEEDPDEGAVGIFKVYRKRPTDPDFVLQDAVTASELAVLLTDQPKGELLSYYIAAANASGVGPPSDAVTITLT